VSIHKYYILSPKTIRITSLMSRVRKQTPYSYRREHTSIRLSKDIADKINVLYESYENRARRNVPSLEPPSRTWVYEQVLEAGIQLLQAKNVETNFVKLSSAIENNERQSISYWCDLTQAVLFEIKLRLDGEIDKEVTYEEFEQWSKILGIRKGMLKQAAIAMRDMRKNVDLEKLPEN